MLLLTTSNNTISWIVDVSTIGSISFGVAFVAGKNLVPKPAAGITAFLISFLIKTSIKNKQNRLHYSAYLTTIYTIVLKYSTVFAKPSIAFTFGCQPSFYFASPLFGRR